MATQAQYVYLESERGLWTVGYYAPDGNWQPESDHGDKDKAARRVAWLNGSGDACNCNDLVAACRLALEENHCTPDTNTALRAALAKAKPKD